MLIVIRNQTGDFLFLLGLCNTSDLVQAESCANSSSCISTVVTPDSGSKTPQITACFLLISVSTEGCASCSISPIRFCGLHLRILSTCITCGFECLPQSKVCPILSSSLKRENIQELYY